MSTSQTIYWILKHAAGQHCHPLLSLLPVHMAVVQIGQLFVFLWNQIYVAHLGTKISATKLSSPLPVHVQTHLNTLISVPLLSAYQVKRRVQNA